MSKLKKLKIKYNKILNSKSINEFFDNLSWSIIDAIAFLTLIMFILSPFIQFIKNEISYWKYGIESLYYEYTLQPIYRFTSVIGIIMIILFIGKIINSNYGLKDFLKKYSPMQFFIPLVVLMIISTCVNGLTKYAAYGHNAVHESLFYRIMYLMIFYFCASIINSDKVKAYLEYAVILISMFVGLTVLWDLHIHPIEQYYIDYMITSVFTNSNHYAYYLTIAILLSSSLFCLEKRKLIRIICMINFIVNTIVLIENNTLGGFIACFFGLIFFLIVSYICTNEVNKRGLLTIGIFVIISLLINFFFSSLGESLLQFLFDIDSIIKNPLESDSAGSSRWRLWKCTVGYIAEKPIFGYGVEGCSIRLELEADQFRPHNEFLEYAAFFGIPAMILYVCGVMKVFLIGLKNKLKLDAYTISALIASFGYLVSSFVGISKYYTAPLFYITLGLAFSGKKNVE